MFIPRKQHWFIQTSIDPTIQQLIRSDYSLIQTSIDPTIDWTIDSAIIRVIY